MEKGAKRGRKRFLYTLFHLPHLSAHYQWTFANIRILNLFEHLFQHFLHSDNFVWCFSIVVSVVLTVKVKIPLTYLIPHLSAADVTTYRQIIFFCGFSGIFYLIMIQTIQTAAMLSWACLSCFLYPPPGWNDQ